MVEHTHPLSDTTKQASTSDMADFLWSKHLPEVKDKESIGVYFASLPSDPIEVVINHKPGTYYKSDYLHYDQYTGEVLNTKDAYNGRFKDAKLADKIIRMNYDMHVGAIFGIPGKILAFFASLIAASLPVTGFMIWWGRRRRQKPVAAAAVATQVDVAEL